MVHDRRETAVAQSLGRGVGERAADGALADVVVAIEVRAAGPFGIVDVEGLEIGETAGLVEAIECGVGAGAGPHVVPGRVHVAGVEAVADAVRCGGEFDGAATDGGEFLERAAELEAGADGALKTQDRAHALGAGEEFFVGDRDALDALFAGGSGERAGVMDE